MNVSRLGLSAAVLVVLAVCAGTAWSQTESEPFEGA